MSPQRIQRKRTKGWRMPEGAVYVGRPSRWGNPYGRGHRGVRLQIFREFNVRAFATHVVPFMPPDWLAPLRGRDLVCWCPMDQPCHADVLLELANR